MIDSDQILNELGLMLASVEECGETFAESENGEICGRFKIHYSGPQVTGASGTLRQKHEDGSVKFELERSDETYRSKDESR